MITSYEPKIAFDHWESDNKELIAQTIYTKWKTVSHIALSQRIYLSGMLLEDIEYLLKYLNDRDVSTVYQINLKGTRFPKEGIVSSTYHLKMIIGMKYTENIEAILQFL